MANQSSDRQRMSNDLRELARLAKPGSDSPIHGFDTADSSGYVDLSAFSTSDAGWVDRELARARKGAPAPLPRPGVRTIDVLTPQSMAPVSLEAFGEPEDTMSSARPSRGRKALTAVLSLAAVGAVGFLAWTLAKHPPAPPTAAATTVAAAVAPPPPVAVPTPPPAVTGEATTTTPAPLAASTTSTTTPASPNKAKTRTAVSRAHAATPAAAPARAAAALPAVVIPKAKPASGNDSLMDLIKKSVATGK